MSDTTTHHTATHQGPVRIRPADVLLTVLVNLLAPMFLYGANGNVDFARMAARETIEEYRVTSRMDLLSVAQIVGFGLGALGSLGLSMMDGIELRLMLRLRSSAVSCNRAAEQNRRALERRQAAIPQAPAGEGYDAAYETQVLASLRQTEIMVAQAQADIAAQVPAAVAQASAAAPPVVTDEIVAQAFADAAVADAQVVADEAIAAPVAQMPGLSLASAPTPMATPASGAPFVSSAGHASVTVPAPIAMPVPVETPASEDVRTAAGTASTGDVVQSSAERQYRAMFAAAMTEVAGEFATDLEKLPLAERRDAGIRAAALQSSAVALLAGTDLQPFAFSPGDATRPSTTR